MLVRPMGKLERSWNMWCSVRTTVDRCSIRRLFIPAIMRRSTYPEGRDVTRTPHHLRTPATSECRMQSFTLGPKHPLLPDEAQEQLEGLEELLKQTWTVWAVSSLFGFEPDSELKLKQYAKKLREEVAAILPHEDVTYDALFTVMDHINSRPSETDPPAIKVEVFSKTNGNGDIEKTIYTGIFQSWRTRETEFCCDNSTRLPLLLCRGTKSSMNAVHTTIGQMFDCIVVTLSAREDELMWLVPLMLNPNANQEKPEKGEVRLEYRVPGLPASDSVAVNFEASALVKMMTAICGNEVDETDLILKSEHVSKFHQAIKTQMLEVAGLQLGLCVLNKVNLPSFTMMDNRMKAFTTEAMNRFLLFFNEMALRVLHTLDYDTTQTLTSETFASN